MTITSEIIIIITRIEFIRKSTQLLWTVHRRHSIQTASQIQRNHFRYKVLAITMLIISTKSNE